MCKICAVKSRDRQTILFFYIFIKKNMSELPQSRSSQRMLKNPLGEVDQYKVVVNHENNDFFKSYDRSQTEDWKQYSHSNIDFQFHVFPQSKKKYSNNWLEVPQAKRNLKSDIVPDNLSIKIQKFQGHQEEQSKISKPTNPSKTLQSSTEMQDIEIELKQALLDTEDQSSSFPDQRSVSRIRSNNVKIQQNRLGKISKQNKQRLKIDKFQWSWDTSAALIRLMIRRSTTRLIMNLYIWILLFLRLYYLLLMIYYLSAHEQQIDNFTFFWWVFAVYIGVRIIFAIIVLKILTMSNVRNDQKIKIVQQVYLQIIEENKLQLQVLQELEIQKKLGGSSINLRHYSEQQKINGLQRRLISLQIMMVIVPPEFSFIFLISGRKQQSGYYQVQNFILKSLEIFFFVPFLIYFLNEKLSFTDIVMIAPSFNIYYITSIILLIDLILFTMLVGYLLANNQRNKTPLKNKK